MPYYVNESRIRWPHLHTEEEFMAKRSHPFVHLFPTVLLMYVCLIWRCDQVVPILRIILSKKVFQYQSQIIVGRRIVKMERLALAIVGVVMVKARRHCFYSAWTCYCCREIRRGYDRAHDDLVALKCCSSSWLDAPLPPRHCHLVAATCLVDNREMISVLPITILLEIAIR